MMKKKSAASGTGGSSKQGTSTGSGSRPMGGKYKIADSSPSNKRTLDRGTKYLK